VPLAHSASALHVLAQAPDVHMNGVHGCEVALHVPLTQVPASLSVDVLVQIACEQIVPSAYFWQWPPPSHFPFVSHVGAPLSVQPLPGSTLPAIIAAHVPAEEPTLQAKQAPQLGASQQTPSTQLVVWHSTPVAQVCPFAFFGTQLPPTPVQ
jgi:hypothetical protein